MVLAIMLHACVLTLVAFWTLGFFTVVFALFLALVTAMLQSSMACKTALRIESFEVGTATKLRAV